MLERVHEPPAILSNAILFVVNARRNFVQAYSGGILLTYADILKLCIPFFFAILLIWIKEAYIAYRERRQKMEALWRILVDSLAHLADADRTLQEMARHYKDHHISPRMIASSFVPVRYAARLAELDRKYAYLYGAYEIEAEGADKRDKSIDKLREQYAQEHDECNCDKLAEAFQEQAELARKESLDLAEMEVAILDRIRHVLNEDQQTVTQYTSTIREMRRRIETSAASN